MLQAIVAAAYLFYGTDNDCQARFVKFQSVTKRGHDLEPIMHWFPRSTIFFSLSASQQVTQRKLGAMSFRTLFEHFSNTLLFASCYSSRMVGILCAAKFCFDQKAIVLMHIALGYQAGC